MIRAWRIVKDRHATNAYDGEGARLYGGRWNSPGVPVVYAAGSVSLAMLEMMVHLRSEELLSQYQLIEASFDETLVHEVSGRALPRHWQKSPAPAAAQRLGDEWIRNGKYCVLRLPSAVVPVEFNYLLNPRHVDFGKIGIDSRRAIRFDARLARR